MGNENAEVETAVAVQEEKKIAKKNASIAALLHTDWKDRIVKMLPEPEMIDRFMYCAELQYGKNRAAFDNCSKVSLLNCLMTSAKYGILPDGRDAYLIPYGNECTLRFDYKGLVNIIIRDGVAKKVYAEVVCENDSFEFVNGEVRKHAIAFPRGKMLGAYCIITLPDGTTQQEIMDIEDIEKIKACSQGSSHPKSPWNTFYKEMAKKSVFRRATKWLKLSPDVASAIAEDNDEYDFGNADRGSRKTLFAEPKKAEEIEPTDDCFKEETVGEKVKKIEEAKKPAKDLPF